MAISRGISGIGLGGRERCRIPAFGIHRPVDASPLLSAPISTSWPGPVFISIPRVQLGGIGPGATSESAHASLLKDTPAEQRSSAHFGPGLASPIMRYQILNAIQLSTDGADMLALASAALLGHVCLVLSFSIPLAHTRSQCIVASLRTAIPASTILG